MELAMIGRIPISKVRVRLETRAYWPPSSLGSVQR
jgi:hypothetical protein